MAIRVRITTTDILMGVTVVVPGTVTVASGIQAYPTWQKIRAIAQSGFDPWCPFTFDSLTVSDTQSFSFDTPKSDDVTATDSASWYLSFYRSPSDAVTATDAFASIATMFRTVGDPVTATDTVAPVMAFNSAFGDAVTVTDICIAGFQFYQTPNDIVAADDTTIAFSQSKPLGDTTSATDALAFATATPVGDTTTATDSVAQALAMPRTASDSAAVSDSLQIEWQRANIYGDTANASPLNQTALNSSTAWVEQWTFNY